ncbi:MAG: DUF853 family protein [Lachnospiraceae bacterium]|nr:DUF853 family protein [Lachnospiraceae bacterium]
MFTQNIAWIGSTAEGKRVSILPRMANRHGLIAGATGTGKTITLKVLAEAFSDMGVPVFLADVKGDVSGLMQPGEDSPKLQERISRFGLAEAGFAYRGYPVTVWDIYGQNGVPLRTTISEMGPLLLARILQLNDLQSDILGIVFKIADDEGLLLLDTKDLKAMLNWVDEHQKELAPTYGKMSTASLGSITRAVVALEMLGGDIFFGEPALNIRDWFTTSTDGRGMMQLLNSESLINNPALYATFLLWLMSELFETLPEVGDMEKPKMVFFFDEAHLLFANAPKPLLDKIEQVVKLIRSKGVGIYFCTQNPRDIPDGVLAQLGNRIEHALRAYTPADQKAVRAAADSFRVNPAFDTYETIMALGTGEAVVSFLQEDGTPGMAEKVAILPPQSAMKAADPALRTQAVQGTLAYTRYAAAVDSDSAYEILQRLGIEEEAAAEQQRQAEAQQKEQEKAEALQAKQAEKYAVLQAKLQAQQEAAQQKLLLKQQEMAAKQAEKEAAAAARVRERAVKSVGNSVVGTVGREMGKQLGKGFGSFGKTLGGNVGASLGRGLFSTLFKR